MRPESAEAHRAIYVSMPPLSAPMGGVGLWSVYCSVYQTASARCDQLTFGWDRWFACSMTTFGWSASHSFTLASRLSNCGFRLPVCAEKIFSFMVHPSLGEREAIDAMPTTAHIGICLVTWCRLWS